MNLKILNGAEFINSNICAEAAQKKGEFGGARAEFGEINCDGGFMHDENSIIAEAFTLNHGKYVGIVYGGSSRKQKKIYHT